LNVKETPFTNFVIDVHTQGKIKEKERGVIIVYTLPGADICLPQNLVNASPL
jgi:hypothetical protein